MTPTEIVKLATYLRDQFWSEEEILKLINYITSKSEKP